MSRGPIDLAALDPAAVARFGGKACGLAALLRAGARVPEGFALAASTVLPASWSEAERATVRERAAALARGGLLAVRSSAVGEDSAAHSFAGLFDTVLGVADGAGALAAAARCIGSGRGERVRAYAGAAAAEEHPVGLVFQRQVAAVCAGVCFTRDPNGRDGALLIEAVRGLGEGLVAGALQPERWRVYPSGLGGGETRRDGPCAGERDVAPPVLTGALAERIAAEAARLAGARGRPLDLEWAVAADGVVWWLQARPITAAVPVVEWVVERAHPGVDDGPVTVWSNMNVRETMPEPLTPLAGSVWQRVILPAVAAQLCCVRTDSTLLPHLVGVERVHGRIYWNLNATFAMPLVGPLLARFLEHIDARTGATVKALLAAGVLRPRRLPVGKVALCGHLLLGALAGLRPLVKGLFPERCLAELRGMAEAIRRRPEVGTLPDGPLVAEMDAFAYPESTPFREGIQMMLASILILGGATWAFRRHPRALGLLAAGVRGNPTTEISVAIDGLVVAARPLAALFAAGSAPAGGAGAAALLARIGEMPDGRPFAAALAAFWRENGQRCPGEFDIGVARWEEDPAMILALVRAGLAAPAGGERVAERLARLARERAEAIGAAAAGAPAWRLLLMRWFAARIPRHTPLREAPKHFGLVAFRRMRQVALEAGRRLAARGRLARAEEVFLLEWSEAAELLLGDGRASAAGTPGEDLKTKLAARRERYARFQAEAPPDLIRSDGVPVVEEGAAGASAGGGPHGVGGDAPGLLRGVGASVGTARGRVCILRTPDPAAMGDGDVLVVRYADPGWTPLFPRAAALVMEVGGAMCHAAVVARELGVPAVFGVPHATARLAAGALVEVDGARGTVRVLG
ncbi:MAG: hypothetical protein HZA54_03780 [Planctomycetes bacterium]|nr:hypothetical protein [Planctomycetota bacterium]